MYNFHVIKPAGVHIPNGVLLQSLHVKEDIAILEIS